MHEIVSANKDSIINSTNIKSVQLEDDFDFLNIKKAGDSQAKPQTKSRREILAKYLSK